MTREEFYQQVIGDMCDEVYALGREAALDEAWAAISADINPFEDDDDAEGFNRALRFALESIEKLGGMDPAKRGKE